MNKTKKIALLGLLLSISIVLSIVENMIPFTVGIPGVKLGLANIVSLIVLIIYGFEEAMSILVVRVLIVSLSFGGFSSAIYGYFGGVLSVIGMYLIYRLLKDKVSCIGISVVGAVCHNLGQVTAAVLIISNARIYSYLSMLLLASIITGIITGTISNGVVRYFKSHRIA